MTFDTDWYSTLTAESVVRPALGRMAIMIFWATKYTDSLTAERHVHIPIFELTKVALEIEIPMCVFAI